jgi:penicillin-binding protein 1A
LSSRARILLGAGAFLVLAAGAAAAAFYLAFVRDLPDMQSLADYRPSLTSVVLDREGVPIGEFYEFRRRVIPLEQVPKHVIQAFLAAEDDSFYEHSGVDYVSIARAAWSNLVSDRGMQGASTITQQTVKQLLLSPERTYQRKIRELILARRLEQRFTKDEILFLYLNEIYFGSGAYGIAEAARTYFAKDVGALEVGEAALLAGMPKAPGRFSPHVNPARAEERRLWVVGRMLEEGFIDEATHRAAQPPPRFVAPVSEASLAAAYFTENVRRRLVALLGNEVVLKGGLVIETTLDARLQREAVLALRRGLEAYDQRHGWRGALRRVKKAELDAEIEKLGEENALVDGADPITSPLGPTRLGVLVATDEGHALVAFAKGVDARFTFADAKWAEPAKNLRVGDVAHFYVSRGENGALTAVLHQQPEAQGALLALDLPSGDVAALVGGYEFAASELDRATQSLRQPGSAFKPIVYTAAIANGLTPASIVMDSPVVYDNFRPENYGRRFLGALTLAEALARSVNNAAVHLLEDVGIAPTISLARRLGIRSELEPGLALALGASSVSLLELTRAYAVLGAGGRIVEPRMIVRVLDRDGQVLLEGVPLEERTAEPEPAPPAEEPADDAPAEAPLVAVAERETVETAVGPEPTLPDGYALPPAQAYVATSLLRAPIEHPAGTGHAAAALGRPLAGKTGTTNDHTDAWFVGFSPELAAGVWVGFDQNRLLGKGETGGRAALPIWMDFMRPALEGRPVRDFSAPPGVVFARIDAKTGGLATASSESTLFQAFLEGTEPVQSAEATAAGTDTERAIELGF